MSYFEKMMNGFKKKPEQQTGEVEALYKQKLKAFVYDDEVVKELLPVFTKLHGTQELKVILDILETKERQIETISGGDLFKQQVTQEDDVDEVDMHKQTSETEKVKTAEEILAEQFKQ